MITSTNSISSTASMMRSSTMQRQPPPGKDLFKVSDTDGNGVISETELETLVKGIEKVTGKAIDQVSLSSFDADGDGGLNGEELLGLMQKNGFSGPERDNAEGEDTGMRPPPPPTQQVLASYAANSWEDMISQLLAVLQNGTDTTSEITSIDVTS